MFIFLRDNFGIEGTSKDLELGRDFCREAVCKERINTLVRRLSSLQRIVAESEQR